MNNSMDLIKQYVSKGLTPKQIVQQMAGNNPILANVIQMAEKGDNAAVEQFARNIMAQRGLNFEEQLTSLKNTFNIK